MAKWGEVLSIHEFRKLGDGNAVEFWVRYQAKSKGGVVFTEELKKDEATDEKVEQVLSATAAKYDNQLKM